MAAKIGNVTADQLRSIVERIERLEEEKKNISSDVRDVYAEAKANGYDAKAIRQIIRLRKLDNHERDEEEYTLDLYKRALGMAPDVADEEEQPEMGLEGGSNKDPLYDDAVKFVRQEGKVSINGLMKQFKKLGFTRSEAIIQRMETDKVVTAQDSAGRRKVIKAKGKAA